MIDDFYKVREKRALSWYLRAPS
jgi:hypothetical protein